MDKLLKAAEKGKLNQVQKLINKGANVNFSGDFGFTPLYKAIINNRVEVVNALLDAGADVEKLAASATPLYWAASKGRTEIVKLLLDRGADTNGPPTAGKTALYAAVEIGYKNTVKLLLEGGGNVNARVEKHNWSPLHVAIASNFGPINVSDLDKNRKEVVEILLQFGADLYAKEDSHGWQPLHIACLDGKEKLAEILLDAGADVNAIDDEGMTPLLWAVSSGKVDCVKLLLDRGADPNLRHPESGSSPIQMAYKFEFPLVANLIQQYGGSQ